MPFRRFKKRKVIIALFALVVVLVGISAINKKLHFSSKLDKITGQVEGIFIADKFLDSIPAVIPANAIVTSPYQDISGNVVISGNGNLGIGTANPQTSLHILNGAPRIAFTDTDQPASTTNPNWIVRSRDEGSFLIQSTPDFTTYTDRLVINSNGNVGIGTLTPEGKIHAVNTLTFDGSIQNKGSYNWGMGNRMDTTVTGTNTATGGWSGGSVLSLYGKVTATAPTGADVESLWIRSETTGNNQAAYGIISELKLAGTTNNGGYGIYVRDDNASVAGGLAQGLVVKFDYSGLNNIGANIITGYPQLRLQHRDAINTGLYWNIGPDNGQNNFTIYNQGGTGAYLLNSGSPLGWQNNSDQRLKTNIKPLSSNNGLNAILKLNPVSFNWKNTKNSKVPQPGFIAQEVQKIFPEIVSTGPDSTIMLTDGTKETVSKPLGLNYDSFIAPIVKAIQELAQNLLALTHRVDTQETKIQALQQEVQELKQEIQLLKQNR